MRKELETIKQTIQNAIDTNNTQIKALENIVTSLEDQSALQLALGSLQTSTTALNELLDTFDDVKLQEVKEYHDHHHGHHHDPKEKKKQINRLSRVIGHMEYVKRMMESDEDCSQVLMQISASKSALNGLAKQIMNEHMTHCITHAIEDGNMEVVEEFQKVMQKYI